MAGLVELFGTDPTVAACLDAATAGARTLDVTIPDAARPLLVAALSARTEAPLLLVTSTFREAENAVAVLGSLLSPDEVAYYPAWETLPHERLSPRSDTVGRRLTVLRRLLGNDELPTPRVVVAPVRAVLQPQVAGLGKLLPVRLVAGEDYEITEVARALVDAGLPPGRPGRTTGRVLRPRRHRGRLPAHQRASGPDRLLRRHHRGDPTLLGRRSAFNGRTAARDHRLALPGTADHRGREGPGRRAGPTAMPVSRARSARCSTRSPRATPSMAWKRSPRCWWTAWNC